ncbi:hypothetical protein OF83DRAFT_30818 [Amylostereum chailletii]|nr:hypothetical protein OF83DRAFT_30818 [Amylostereum chailletii]
MLSPPCDGTVTRLSVLAPTRYVLTFPSRKGAGAYVVNVRTATEWRAALHRSFTCSSVQRPLALHISALNDEKYAFFTHSLSNILAPETFDRENAPYEGLSVSIRGETRAWLRGRYQDLSVSDLDQILQLFAPLASDSTLTGNQFFALLRIVLHVRKGATLDRSMVFVQTDPKATAASPRTQNPFNAELAPRLPAPSTAIEPSGSSDVTMSDPQNSSQDVRVGPPRGRVQAANIAFISHKKQRSTARQAL